MGIGAFARLCTVEYRLRPDEAWGLQFRDVIIVDEQDPGKRILEIELRGKRGVGYCKSMPGGVRPFERLKARLHPADLDSAPRGNTGAPFTP